MGAQKETRHKAERKAARYFEQLEQERQRQAARDADTKAGGDTAPAKVPHPRTSRSAPSR
jgi:hypothetical protein